MIKRDEQKTLFENKLYNNNKNCVIYLNLSKGSRVWQTLKFFYDSKYPLGIPDLRKIYSKTNKPPHANTLSNHIKTLIDNDMIGLYRRNTGKKNRTNLYLITTIGELAWEKYLNKI